MTTYPYPKVSSGYRWNLLKRCLNEVGLEPTCVSDVNEETWLEFSRSLTTIEKTALDTLMAGDPQNPPTTGVKIVIKDIWEDGFEKFITAAALPNLRLYYSESIPGSGKIDRITLWHPTALTNTEKNRIKTAFTSLYIG